MVYYLTLHRACIGIVGASRMTRRSASAKDHLHHPRGKHGREDGRNGAAGKATGSGRPSSIRRPTTPRRPDDRRPPDVRDIGNRTEIQEITGSPGATGRPVPPEPPDVRCPADDRHLSAYSVRARGPCIPLSPLTYPFVDLDYIYSSTSTILGSALV